MLVQATSFLRELEKRGPLTRYDGVVDASHYWPAVASFGLSPSALERLAECPFRFFAGRMLDLEELEEPEGESELTSIETGVVYHDILEQYHRALVKAFDEASRYDDVRKVAVTSRTSWTSSPSTPTRTTLASRPRRRPGSPSAGASRRGGGCGAG